MAAGVEGPDEGTGASAAESEHGPTTYTLVSEASETSNGQTRADSEVGPTVFTGGVHVKVIRPVEPGEVHPADARAQTETRRHR